MKKKIWKVLLVWMGSETKKKLEQQDEQNLRKTRRSIIGKSAIQKVQLELNGN
jgi:hypothetical protein